MKYSISSIPWVLIFPASTCRAFRTLLLHQNRWGPNTQTLHGVSTLRQSSLNITPPDRTGSDAIKTVDVLSLESIRSTLIRQEETIIFALIERAQFRRNDIVYQSGGFGDLGLPLGSFVQSVPIHKSLSEDKHYPQVPLSFLEYMLMGTVCSMFFFLEFCVNTIVKIPCTNIFFSLTYPLF